MPAATDSSRLGISISTTLAPNVSSRNRIIDVAANLVRDVLVEEVGALHTDGDSVEPGGEPGGVVGHVLVEGPDVVGVTAPGNCPEHEGTVLTVPVKGPTVSSVGLIGKTPFRLTLP